MNIFKYILRSLKYYRRQHLAVLGGTLISTAVLTGALVIGDSVRLSLLNLVDLRLGKVEYVFGSGDRFFRTQLAKDLAVEEGVQTASLFMITSIAINTETNTRINSAYILGVNNDFWQLSNIADMPALNDEEAIISTNIANKLNLQIGDWLLLKVENTSVIPINAPFVKEGDPSIGFRVKIIGIADNNQLGRFSLSSNQIAPYNVYVSQEYLAGKLDMKGLVNIILVRENEDSNINTRSLDKAIKGIYTLKDVGLDIKEVEGNNLLEIVSDRIFIDKPLATSINKINQPKIHVLTYLVNAIRFNEKETPYSFVTATSKFLLSDELKDNEIIVNEWLSEDLGLNVGDEIQLDYYVIGPLRYLVEESKIFIVKAVIPNQSEFVNKSLMPLFPGLSDAGNCDEWETGVPIDLDKIRDKDEDYWDDYRGTPKAFISLKTGLELWENKYGNYTSIRFDKEIIDSNILEAEVIKKISLSEAGLNFISIKEKGVLAASNSIDFGGLFLSLSFFVIAAGILLTILIYSLNTESRQYEAGVLAALGFSRRLIIKLRFIESLLIAITGSIVGVGIGLLYSMALMEGINSVWQDIVRTTMMEVFIVPGTLVLSGIIGIVIALLTIFLITRKKLKQPIIFLIKRSSNSIFKKIRKNRILDLLLILIGVLGSISIILISITSEEVEDPGLFLSAGGLFLIGVIGLINLLLKRNRGKKQNSQFGLFGLAMTNASRNKARTMATIILLSIGTFSIIITGANRQTFYGQENNRESGTGGFLFWSETTMPILNNLNTIEGKSKYGLEGKLDSVEFIQMFNLDGDDASCLNLNQVNNPSILGINPLDFDKRNSFTFLNTLDDINNAHHWLDLHRYHGKNVIPAIADQSVLTWGIKKKVGDTLTYIDEAGNNIKLLLIGGLANSIFQGNVLISDSIFRKHFPTASGSRLMLVDAPYRNQKEIFELLNTYLVDYGIELTPASQRLADFNSVTNTYLAVFMILGGLGVIIGTLGFAVVLLRNIFERRFEFALLLALGFKKNELYRIIFLEYIFILLAGLISGIGAAVIGIIPSLISLAFTLDLFSISLIILVILITGLLSIFIPAYYSLKGDLIKSLRSE